MSPSAVLNSEGGGATMQRLDMSLYNVGLSYINMAFGPKTNGKICCRAPFKDGFYYQPLNMMSLSKEAKTLHKCGNLLLDTISIIISESNRKLYEMAILPLLNCTILLPNESSCEWIENQPGTNRSPRYFVLSTWRRPFPPDIGCSRRPSLPASAAPVCGRCAHARRRPHARTFSRIRIGSLLCFSSPPNEIQGSSSMLLFFHT